MSIVKVEINDYLLLLTPCDISYVKATLPCLQNVLLNEATYDCSFANLSPIFTIFGIQVSNDIVDRSHDFGCHGNHFGGRICVTIVTKMGILLN